MTKLYGLVVLAVAAGWLGSARAQESTEDAWLACMNVWNDESMCGPRPAPTVPEEPTEEPTPPEEPTLPPPPPPPPAADTCGKGNQNGFGLSHSRGGAKGHCDRDDRGGRKHKHSRRNDHHAKVKAALNRLAQWCKAMARSGRHS